MSGKRKPMSADQKRETMLNLLSAAREPMNLKELEAQGNKAGVVQNTIKDCIDVLLSERKIESDKIGSGVFFWCFPTTAYLQTKTAVEQLEAQLRSEGARAAEVSASLAALSADAAAAGERAEKLGELEALKSKAAALEVALKEVADHDPAVSKALMLRAKVAKAGADRWTDAALTLKSHLVKKFGMTSESVSAMLGIDDNFDYVT